MTFSPKKTVFAAMSASKFFDPYMYFFPEKVNVNADNYCDIINTLVCLQMTYKKNLDPKGSKSVTVTR